jgi:molybdopterin-synthase adenylyltransferase
MLNKYPEENYWEIIDRQKGILNKKEQLKLKDSKITVIGCGGIGGAVIEMLARMGVGNLRIVDKDSFDLSNINRQLMSSTESIGRPKTEVTKEIISSITPFTEVEAFSTELNENNVQKILEGSDVIVDALDNIISRILTSRCAVKLGIPFVHGAIHGTMGQITTLTPETPSYEETFKLPSAGKDLTPEIISKVQKLNKEVPPVIGPVPNIIGCLQAFEVVKILTGRENIITAPDVLMFDLLKKDPFFMFKF